jgi:hypothetical protein
MLCTRNISKAYDQVRQASSSSLFIGFFSGIAMWQTGSCISNIKEQSNKNKDLENCRHSCKDA